jgi:DNA-binding CsgD family transcriptional regulator
VGRLPTLFLLFSRHGPYDRGVQRLSGGGLFGSERSGRRLARSGAPLLERGQEVAECSAALEEAAAGRGAMLVIEGPPGIGKTALLQAVRDRAEADGWRVLSARALEGERDLAFAGVRQLLDPVLRGCSPEEAAELLSGAARPAAALFGGDPVDARLGADPGFAVLNALYWVLAELADVCPLLIAVDDAHWLDLPSLRLLDFLAPRVEELPAVVAVATRSPQEDGSGAALDRILSDPAPRLVRPAPLSRAASAELVRAWVGEEPDPPFVDACLEVTAGNPFYLVELMRDLALKGVGPTVSEAAAVRRIGPRSVSLMVRFRAVGSSGVALARSLSVLGDGAPLWQVAELAGLAPEAAQRAADALTRDSILAGGPGLAFAHPIVRTAIYAHIDPHERASAHRRAAEILRASGAPVERVATQLIDAEPAANPAVVDTLRAAARRVLAQGAPEVAAHYLRRALAESPDPDARPGVLLELGLAEASAADPAALDHLLEAHVVASEARTRAEAAAVAAWQLFISGRAEETAAILAQADEELAVDDPDRALEFRARLLSFAIYDPSTFALHLSTLDTADEDLTAESAGARAMLSHLAYVRMWRSQDAARAAELAERALASGKLLAERGSESPELNAVAMTLIHADRLEPAARLLDAAAAQARERGSRFGFAHVSFLRSELVYRQGALLEAEADARASLEITVALGHPVPTAAVTGSLVSVLLERGALVEAADALAAIGTPIEELPPQPQYNNLFASRGRLRIREGNVVAGLADLKECGRRNERLELHHPSFVSWRADAALAHRALGELGEARALAEEELAAARDWGTPGAIGAAIRLLGLLSTADESIDLLRQAASLIAESPARLEHARARVDLGAALRRNNRRSEAREPLTRGLDLADRCGAEALCRLARHELAAMGVRPRRARLIGIDSLTASERRVAQMAAEGLSNTEIAQALFVTRKTIEKHLGNAYTKLRISSRNQLRATLRSEAD